MSDTTDKPKMVQRRYPAHPVPGERFNEQIVVFCTVCILGRRALLDNAAAVQAVQLAWRDAVQWRIGEFLCMPDHLHFFCVPGVLNPESIAKWCRYWKRLASQHYSVLKGQWQMDVWDTQIRDINQYTEKLSYMRQNPQRKNLVDHWEDWLFRGVWRVIEW